MSTGRFAPSPTGPLHLGNLRTALVAWCYARSARSSFLIRVEDLGTQAGGAPRSPDHEAGQLADLAALGIDHDGAILRQSERVAAHDDAVGALEAAGLTYPCFCSRREIREAVSAPHGDGSAGVYPGTCAGLSQSERAARLAEGRRPATRLRASGAVVSVRDERLGVHRSTVDDFVLRRGDGVPAYNLAVVLDDAYQGVEQVVRGDDLLSSTPRQVLLQSLLGLPTPRYAHIPLVLGADGARLAKRHGAVTLADQLALGYGPQAVLGRLAASLGLAELGEELHIEEVVDRFDPLKLPTEPWIYDEQ